MVSCTLSHFFRARTTSFARALALALALALVHVLALTHVILSSLAVQLLFLVDLAKVWNFELGLGPVFSKRGCAAFCTIKFVKNNSTNFLLT